MSKDYTITWVPEMGIFKLERSDRKRRPITEKELREAFEGNANVQAWIDMAKANPGHPVQWGS